jgi:hypothetical protein
MRQPQAATLPADASELLAGKPRVAPLPPVHIFGCPARDAVDELETRSRVMELIPPLSTLEPHPAPNGAYGLSPREPRVPGIGSRDRRGMRRGFGSHGSTVAGLMSLPTRL